MKVIPALFYICFGILILLQGLTFLDYDFLDIVDYGDGLFESTLIVLLCAFFLFTLILGWITLFVMSKKAGNHYHVIITKVMLVFVYALTLWYWWPFIFPRTWDNKLLYMLYLLIPIVPIVLSIYTITYKKTTQLFHKIIYGALNTVFALAILWPIWFTSHLFMSDQSG